MKILATTTAIIMIATSSFAGEISMSSAAHLPSESAAIGAGSAAQWVIPLLALALIGLAAANTEDACNPKVEKCPI